MYNSNTFVLPYCAYNPEHELIQQHKTSILPMKRIRILTDNHGGSHFQPESGKRKGVFLFEKYNTV